MLNWEVHTKVLQDVQEIEEAVNISNEHLTEILNAVCYEEAIWKEDDTKMMKE